MTGRVIDRETAGFLILLIPLAVAAVVLLETWPWILALIGLTIVWQLWQNYQWLKWSEKVNPLFNQLIKENQGCLTVVDLSLRANLSGNSARRFLEKKAQEYGALKKGESKQATVYYFLTASALGSILDESEPTLDLDEKTSSPNPTPQLVESSLVSVANLNAPVVEQLVSEKTPVASETTPTTNKPQAELEVSVSAQTTKPLTDASITESTPVSTAEMPVPEVPVSEESPTSETTESTPVSTPEMPVPEVPVSGESPASETTESTNLESLAIPETESEEGISENSAKITGLIQAELAKRLEITPSTLGRRKSDPDFPDWSQNRDPEGVAWKYIPETKLFVPIEI